MKKKFEPAAFAIPNLTLGLVVLTGLVNGLDLVLGGSSPGFSLGMLLTADWWNVFLFPFRISDSWISLALYLYIFFMFGQQLEEAIGTLRYNLYILTGIIFVLLGTAFYPLTAQFVYLSVFLAIAHLAPDMQILLFFVIPVKMRWIALLTVGFVLYSSISMAMGTQSAWPLLGPVLGFANYLIFFAAPSLLRKGGISRSASFKRKASPPATIHRCTVCGLTEGDDPTMDFRYCVSCDDHEYCSQHLHTHEHISG